MLETGSTKLYIDVQEQVVKSWNLSHWKENIFLKLYSLHFMPLPYRG